MWLLYLIYIFQNSGNNSFFLLCECTFLEYFYKFVNLIILIQNLYPQRKFSLDLYKVYLEIE